MLPQDNLLSSMDRLSRKSALSDKTGTFIGILGSVGFIVASVLIFIGLVVSYFNGDYIQGIFKVNEFQPVQLYSGCTFKLAISFYNKASGQIIDHQLLKNFFDIKVVYIQNSMSTFYANTEPCRDQYFQQMDKNYQFKSSDCLIMPDHLGFISTDSVVVFGFSIQSTCIDALSCTPISGTQFETRKQNFLKQHYYVLRFSSNYLDEQGKKKKKFFQIYSTQYDAPDVVMSQVAAIFQTQKVYIDSSIMPWANNETYFFSTWKGLSAGLNVPIDYININGIYTYMYMNPTNNVYFRQYRKLDWLLGVLGGGIFLLYLFFWVVCQCLTTIKQKVQNAKSIVILSSELKEIKTIDLYKPNFRFLWYISSIFPFNLRCWGKQNKMIYQAEKFMDIAQLLKKLKVAVKNNKLQINNIRHEPRTLQLLQNQGSRKFTQKQLKYQLLNQKLEDIMDDQNVCNVYSNNLYMLLLYSEESGKISNQNRQKISQITQALNYSKQKKPDFLQKQSQGCCQKLCKNISRVLSKFLQIFDIYGARPTLIGSPHDSSCFGCLVTLLILVLSILTFALTIYNMKTTRTHWDQIYLNKQHQVLNMKTGTQFKSLICFHPYAFLLGYVEGKQRLLDVKFYQVKRQGQNYSQNYYSTQLASTAGKYFDVGDQKISLSYCLKPSDNISIEIYGDQKSERQAYVGFKLTPYCGNTTQYCNANINQTYSYFYSFLNVFYMWFTMPYASYYPDAQKVMIRPYQMPFSDIVQQIDLNIASPIQQTISLNCLYQIDDRPNWITGDILPPSIKYLSAETQLENSVIKSVSGSFEPYFKLKINFSGKVQRVIFTNYKLDFLFSVMGGCFAFYYFFFACFGKAYNNYKLKVKLAETLYGLPEEDISTFKYFLTWLRIPCCRQEQLKKVQQDISSLELAKNINNVYQLSAVQYQSALEKDLSLLYLKERVNIQEQIIINQKNQSQQDEEQDDDNFQEQWDEVMQKRSINNRKNNRVANAEASQQHSQNDQDQQQSEIKEIDRIYQPLIEYKPTIKQTEKCGSFVNNYNIFYNDAQLTLNGQRSVKSAFGGCFCLCMLFFICILTSHFWYLYFSGWYRVSKEQFVDTLVQSNYIKFQVGKNFKMALSFNKIDSFSTLDVNSILSNVNVSIIKYKTSFVQGQFVQKQLQKIHLQPCTSKYFQNFNTANYIKNDQFYDNLDRALCIPDGVMLQLYNYPKSRQRGYFSLKITSKYAGNSSSIMAVKYLLQNYIPVYHISNPTMDYSSQDIIVYGMKQFIKSTYYQFSVSRQHNITVTKNQIKFDTAIFKQNQRAPIQSYEFTTNKKNEFENDAFSATGDIYNQLNFYHEQMYNVYTVKTIKINQLFGLIGGCIVLIFVGTGCIPKSYNNFKMRYQIGTKLYSTVRKNSRQQRIRRKIIKKSLDGSTTMSNRHKNKYQLIPQLSDFQIFYSWLCSFWLYTKRNYDSSDQIKHCFLIIYKISRDLNIFKIMKNLHTCQNITRRKDLGVNSRLDLCKVNTKQVIVMQQFNKQANDDLIQELEDYPELINASRINQFSLWQLNRIIQAKNKPLRNLQNILNQKWLDKFLEINRPKSIGSTSFISSQVSRSVLSQSKNSKRSFVKSEKKGHMKIQQLSQKQLSQGNINQPKVQQYNLDKNLSHQVNGNESIQKLNQNGMGDINKSYQNHIEALEFQDI